MNALQGRLGEGVLANLVQYLSLNQASGCLQLVSDGLGRGRVYLQRGAVEHVEVGSEVGLPALTALLGWQEGRFFFRVDLSPPRRTLDLPVDALLLRASYGSDLNGARAGAVDGAAGRSGVGRGNADRGNADLGDRTAGPAQGSNGVLDATPLADPGIASGLAWAAVAVAGPIGEIFVDEAFETIGHSPRLLPEHALGQLLLAVARRFKSIEGRQQFLARAEAVLAHHGYGRVEDDR